MLAHKISNCLFIMNRFHVYLETYVSSLFLLSIEYSFSDSSLENIVVIIKINVFFSHIVALYHTHKSVHFMPLSIQQHFPQVHVLEKEQDINSNISSGAAPTVSHLIHK